MNITKLFALNSKLGVLNKLEHENVQWVPNVKYTTRKCEHDMSNEDAGSIVVVVVV